jgi:chaperonin GroEL (HSP60 family)
MQTDIEITREEDFSRILQMEEEYIQTICEDIIRLKPDLIFTEKGISGTKCAHTLCQILYKLLLILQSSPCTDQRNSSLHSSPQTWHSTI